MTKKELVVKQVNRRHQIVRACFIAQGSLRKKLGQRFPTGLCAGLVQVWWAELRKGNDAIYCIERAPASLIREVLLYQVRSIYLKELPDSDNGFSVSETELLRFKYGAGKLSEVESLQRLFGVGSALELDLVLQHELPILQKWEFAHFGLDVVNALAQSGHVGLHLLLIRFRRAKRLSGEIGHRTALVIEAGGSCRYYDPRWGELVFSEVAHFVDWFTDYWMVGGWERKMQRGLPTCPPIRIFVFGGAFSPAAQEKSVALRSSLLESIHQLENHLGIAFGAGFAE
jgi:hypothetical protein